MLLVIVDGIIYDLSLHSVKAFKEFIGFCITNGMENYKIGRGDI